MKKLASYLALILMAFTATATAQSILFPSAQLQTERGDAVDFYPTLVEGRTVAIQFVFTSCTMVCPLLGANFAVAQREVTQAGVNDVHFISVSIDPARDTPERLTQWRAKYGGLSSNWTLVTGEKREIDRLLKSLEVFTAEREEHSGFILVGNDRRGNWKRINGLSGGQLISQALLDAR